MSDAPPEKATKSVLKVEKHVLSSRYSGGPQGLGDPEDRTLRKIELDVLVSKSIRERLRTDTCKKEYEDFLRCGKEHPAAMFYKCRGENDEMQSCFKRGFNDPVIMAEGKEQYLKERSEFRRTGIMKPKEQRWGTKEWKAARLAAESSQLPASDGSHKA